MGSALRSDRRGKSGENWRIRELEKESNPPNNTPQAYDLGRAFGVVKTEIKTRRGILQELLEKNNCLW